MYHIRIDFCTSGYRYYDLVNNQFRVIIDGKISYIYDFNNNGDEITHISIGSFRNALGESYIDSIGLSWDENYDVGDNYHFYESSIHYISSLQLFQ